jgi:hypothetical protein
MSSKSTAPSKVKTTWPGAFGIYKLSQQAVKTNLWPLVSCYLVSFLIAIVLEAILPTSKNEAWSSHESIKNLLNFVLNVPLITATTYLWLAGTKGEEVSFGDAVRKGITLYVPMLLCVLLLYVLISLSLLALIIPFFFVMPRLVMSTLFLVDKNLDPWESIKASWQASKGHSGKVWGIIGVAFLMVLPCLTIIGIPLSIYWWLMYSAALAILYRYVHGDSLSA